MYYSSGNYEAFARPQKPQGVDEKSAYLIGSGLAAVAGVLLEELQDDGPLTPDNRPRQKIIRNS